MIDTGLGGAKPFHCIAAGKNVLLDAESGNVKAVDHVLRGHDEFHVTSHRNVQFVDFTLPFGVFHFPHPLLCHDINFTGVGGWSPLFEVDERAPDEDHHEDKEGNRAPGNFQSVRTFYLFGADAGTMTVTGGEKDDADKDQQSHHAGNDKQENVERVHVAS